MSQVLLIVTNARIILIKLQFCQKHFVQHIILNAAVMFQSIVRLFYRHNRYLLKGKKKL